MEGQDLELYYEIVTTVMDHAEMSAAAFGFSLLCKGFFRKRETLWMIGATCFLALFIQYHIPIYMGGMFARAIAGAACLLLMFFVEKEVTLQVKAYLALIFFSLLDLSACTAVELYALFTLILQQFMDTWYLSGNMPNADMLYFYTYCITTFLMHVIAICLFLLFVFLVNKAFYDKRSKYGWKEISILLIPSVAGYTVHLLRKTYEALFFHETGNNIMNFYDSHMSIAFLLCLCYLTILVTIVLELYLYQSLRRGQEKEKNRILLQNQMQDMQSHITEVERIYTGIRGVRHDLNHHVYIIGSLLGQERYAEAEQYLKTMQDTIEEFDFPCKTGNPITDVIINEKYRQAEQAGITFHAAFYFIPDTNIDEFDMSIILNNILENAFEAASKSRREERIVSIRSKRKKNAYFITVENPYDAKLCFGRDGLPESEKTDRNLHGLGLKNVRAAVEKYFGTLAIEQKDGVVTLTVMLMLK